MKAQHYRSQLPAWMTSQHKIILNGLKLCHFLAVNCGHAEDGAAEEQRSLVTSLSPGSNPGAGWLTVLLSYKPPQ